MILDDILQTGLISITKTHGSLMKIHEGHESVNFNGTANDFFRYSIKLHNFPSCNFVKPSFIFVK